MRLAAAPEAVGRRARAARDYLRLQQTLYMAFVESVDRTSLYTVEQMLHLRTVPCIVSESDLSGALESLRTSGNGSNGPKLCLAGGRRGCVGGSIGTTYLDSHVYAARVQRYFVSIT
jgi:hypothetical protein